VHVADGDADFFRRAQVLDREPEGQGALIDDPDDLRVVFIQMVV
jgi:hypothetical protein